MAFNLSKTAVTLLAIYVGVAQAQNDNMNVTGCATVGCPNDHCTISNETFNMGVGVAPIPSSDSSLPALSWVKASSLSNSKKPNATHIDSFYLATPPDQQRVLSNDSQACAVFFRRFNASFAVPDSEVEPIQTATGTCATAMQQSCIDALTKRASQVDISKTNDACSALRAAFQDNVDSECSEYAYGLDKWQGIDVRPISGQSSITAEQNATSDCWPILPKTDDLALIGRFETITTYNGDVATANIFEITPVLSVLYPGGDSLVSSAEAQLTCLKLVGPGTEGDPTAQKSGSQGRPRMNANLLVGTACFASAVVLSLIY